MCLSHPITSRMACNRTTSRTKSTNRSMISSVGKGTIKVRGTTKVLNLKDIKLNKGGSSVAPSKANPAHASNTTCTHRHSTTHGRRHAVGSEKKAHTRFLQPLFVLLHTHYSHTLRPKLNHWSTMHHPALSMVMDVSSYHRTLVWLACSKWHQVLQQQRTT